MGWAELRRLVFYFLAPAISVASPLVVIPAVTSRFGADGWAAMAVGLSLGSAGAVLAELGWGVVGPQQIAHGVLDRLQVISDATSSRILAVAVLSPTAFAVAFVIAPEYHLSTAILAAGLVLNALSLSWVFVGGGQPHRVLLFESLPRVGFAVLAGVLILAGWPLETYGAAIALGATTSLLLSSRAARVPPIPSLVAMRQAPRVVREQAIVIAGRWASVAYTSLPTALLAVVSPQAVATFAALDRPMRIGLSVLGGVTARLQSWVGTPNRALTKGRVWRSIGINTVVGVGAGSLFYLGMPLVAPILFSGTVAVPPDLLVTSSLLVVLICTSRGFGLGLVALHAAGYITPAVLAAAVVGLTGVLIGGAAFGYLGASLGLIAAEIVGLVVQATLLIRTSRRWVP